MRLLLFLFISVVSGKPCCSPYFNNGCHDTTAATCCLWNGTLAPTHATETCADLPCPSVCGDLVVQTGEDCDVANASCTSTCLFTDAKCCTYPNGVDAVVATALGKTLCIPGVLPKYWTGGECASTPPGRAFCQSGDTTCCTCMQNPDLLMRLLMIGFVCLAMLCLVFPVILRSWEGEEEEEEES